MTGHRPAEVEIHADLESLSHAAAAAFLACARRAIADAGSFCVGLSGGSTPRRLYELLASPPLLDQVPWGQTHVFWCDERAVPPDAPESNYRLVASVLLKTGQVPPYQVHRMEADADDLEAAAARYEDILRRIACSDERGPFCLDLAVLGMGTDGHTASLFPGSPSVRERDRFVVVSRAGTPITARMTLTFPALNLSRQAIVLVSGADKAAALARVFGDEADPDRLPISGLAPTPGRLAWMVDRAAAAELPEALPGGLRVKWLS